MKKTIVAGIAGAAFLLAACSSKPAPAPTSTASSSVASVSSPTVSAPVSSAPVASSAPASSQTVSVPSSEAPTTTVDKSQVSYAIKGDLLTITVKGDIAPIYVKVQSWSQVDPSAGFPQKPLSAQNFVVTQSVTIKLSSKFYQQDIYASSKNDIKVPAVLNAKTDPQPAFLNSFATGPAPFRTN